MARISLDNPEYYLNRDTSWLAFNEEEKSAKILSLPDRQEMESGVEDQLIVEFYSR